MVVREPEFDHYALQQFHALRSWRSAKCPACGQVGGYRPLPVGEHRDASWVGHRPAAPGEAPDTVVHVTLLRCVYCGSTEAVRGDWEQRHKDDERKGGAIPKDGLIFIAHDPGEED